jgi:asparagine synthase (glutamine-hydrolysing)
MCGFAALFEPSRIFDPGLLAGIEQDLWHRGPDSGGMRSWPGAALVFRRLAIIDPQAASDQPMDSADRRQTLVFNGEIYNYRALRRELMSAGVPLRTEGDSEVILEGWRHWGPAVVDKLEGMYAFVIVDHARGEAFAARDPFGIKPLYLLRHGALIGLASEMRPFARLVPPEPDPEALAELIAFGWAAGSLSNLKHIERVPGGTALTMPLCGGPIHRHRFCDPLDTLAPDEGMTAETAMQQAEAAVEASVEAHLMSDVGYAIELSGGVDSSLVTALATRDAKQKIASYSIDLGAYEHNERRWRDMVAARFPISHHEIAMSGREFADSLPRCVRHIEGPSQHAGCVFIMRLCDEIARHTKVVLTGEGADEMFGGYHRYQTWPRTAQMEHVSRLLPARVWPDRWPFRGVRQLAGRDAGVYSAAYSDPADLEALFPDLIPAPGARGAASARFDRLVDRIFAVDQTAYLESLLMRQDKVSMAASVEARVPFTHLPLARVVNRVPSRLRAPGGATKPILKAIAEKHLPRDLVRRRKIGLWLPLDEWLADRDGLGRYLDDLTAQDGRVRTYGDAAGIDRIVADFRGGRRALSRPLMRMVNLEVWMRGLGIVDPMDRTRTRAPSVAEMPAS